jgi:PAS domain S-box-containing protein
MSKERLLERLTQLLSPGFMPHGYCYLWDPWIVWLHVVSDALITISYYCIPIALFYLVRKRHDLPFNWIFWMFGLFIVGCGTTHLIEIWTVWHASYLLAGVLKALTASVSVCTAVMMVPLIPKALTLPSSEQLRLANRELEIEISRRKQREEALSEALAARDRGLADLTQHQCAIEELQSAQLALSESRNQLNGIIQSAMDAIITVDEQQQIVIFNTAAEKMFGCTSTEATRQTIDRFIPERFRGAHSGHIQSFEKSGVTSRSMGRLGAIWGVRANGEEFPLEASISQAGSGGKRLFTVILRDINERKLQETSLLRLAAIVDSSEEAILSKDLAGNILSWNKAAQKLYGYTAEEAIGKSANLIIPPSLREEESQALSRVALGQTVRREETTRQCKDGTRIKVAVFMSPVRDPDGQVIGVSSISHDISEQRKMEDALRESQQRLASIIDSAMDAIITVDTQQRIILFNTAAEKMFGCPSRQAKGSSIDRFIPERFRKSHASHIRCFGATGVTNRAMGSLSAIWGVRSNGEEFPIEASISQVEAEKTRFFTVILRDITERTRGEEKLRDQAEELSRQAAELTRSQQAIRILNRDLEHKVMERTAELQAINQDLEAFTYSVSHDLRAPLRHLTGFTRILVEDFGPQLPPEAQNHLQRIEQGANRMGRLVDELLGLTRVGRQTLTVQVTSLTSIVKDVLLMLEPEIEGRQVEWEISELPFVECDATLIRQVFQNLISNALKYSRPCPRAVIEIGHTDKDGQQAIFVRDNGVGFSMKYADKLFGVFQRLHRAEDFEGTGVGLATVHRIIQKHGGRVWAESELDRGATFYFTLGGFDQSTVKNAMATARG